MAVTSKHPDSFAARPRVAGAKGLSRRERAQGWVPAVAYGPATPATALSVDPKTFLNARLEHGVAHIYNVDVAGGESFKAIIKEVQRNPVNRELTHIDLYALDMKRPIRLEVRVDLVGKPAGMIHGGILQQILRRIEIQCLPDAIPSHVEADVSRLEIGDSLHISDITLPTGVKATALHDEALAVLVQADRGDEPVATADAAAAPAAKTPAKTPAAKAPAAAK